MSAMFDNDYEFVLRIFNKYKGAYADLLSQSESILPDEIILSSHDMLVRYPYHNAMGKFKKAKIYKEAPVLPESYSINHFKGGKCYLAVSGHHKEWGTWFSIKEDDCVITLQFLGNALKKDNIFTLDQMYCTLHENEHISKVLYYHYRLKHNPKYPPEETFMTDSYCYDGGLLNKIIRDGFRKNKDSILSTSTFSFEYHDKKVSIYAESANINNEVIKSKLYTGAIQAPSLL